MKNQETTATVIMERTYEVGEDELPENWLEMSGCEQQNWVEEWSTKKNIEEHPYYQTISVEF